MAVGNTTYEETLGLFTAGVEITRNASRIARGLVSVQSRLTQTLDEQSSTGQALIAWYDKYNIALFDQEGQLRSTYDVLADVAEIWPTLTTNEQDYFLLTQAGANQTQNLAAILSNFNTAVEATATAYNSAGSAARENARYMESLDARTQALKATFQDLANNVIDNELVSSLLNLANGALKLLNTDVGTFITQVGLLTGVLGGAISLAKYYIPVLGGFGVAAKGAAGGVAALGTAIKAAFPIALVASAAIVGLVAAIGGIKKAYDKAHPSLEELESSIGDTVGAISTNEERLKSLNEIPWANRTPEIQAEIDKIDEENEALREQLELLKQQKAEQVSKSFIEKYGYSTYQYDFVDNSIVVRAQDASEALQEVSKQTGIAMIELSGWNLYELGAVEDISVLAAEAASGWFSSIGAVERYLRLGKKAPQELVNLFFANREAVIALQADLQELAEVYGDDLDPRIASLLNYLEATIPLTADVASALYDIDELTLRFAQGLSLQESEYQALITVHPQLASCLTEQNGLWKLNAEAIASAGEASKEATRQILEDQKEQLQSLLRTAKLQQSGIFAVDAEGRPIVVEAEGKPLSTIISQASQQIAEIDRLLAEIGLNTETDGTTSTSSNAISLAEQQIETLEHELYILEKQGASTDTIIAKQRALQKAITEASKTVEQTAVTEDFTQEDKISKLRELEKAWWDYEAQINKISQEVLEEQKEEAEKQAKELAEALERQLEETEANIQSTLQAVVTASQIATDAEVARLEALISEQEKLVETLESNIEGFETELENIDGAIGYLLDEIDDQIGSLEEQMEVVNQKYDAQAEAIESVNKELDKQIALEEALDNLARARSQKVMVYKDGRYQYVEDIDAVSEAQTALDELKRSQAQEEALERIEQAREKEIASIQAEIDKWSEYKEQWSSVVSAWETGQQREQAMLVFGTDFEKLTWETRITNLDSYKNRILQIHGEIAVAQSQIAQAESNIQGYQDSVSAIQQQASIDQQVAELNAQAAINSAKWMSLDRSTPEGRAEAERLHQANIQLMAQRDALTGKTTMYAGGHYIETSGGKAIGQGFGGYEPYGGLSSSQVQQALTQGTAQAVQDALNLQIPQHANGTLSARGGISLVGERGPELRVLGRGDGVLPNDITRNLWGWGAVSPSTLISQLMNKPSNGASTMSVRIEHLSLPEVKNGQDFVNYLTNNLWRQAVQFVSAY